MVYDKTLALVTFCHCAMLCVSLDCAWRKWLFSGEQSNSLLVTNVLICRITVDTICMV